jgi:uncharacterized protein with HEPN domain
MKMSDYQRIQKILSTGTQMLQLIHTEQITQEIILTDFKAQWLLTTPLYNIGEHVYNLSSELKKQHPEVPWSKIAGMRHRLVHNYDDTNWNIINDIVFHDLEAFLQQLEEISLSVPDE